MNLTTLQGKKILILGAAGFIGTNLTFRLAREECSLVCFDRPDSNMKHLSGENISTACGFLADFADDDRAEELLQGTDIVYHLISTTCPTNSNIDIASEMQDNVISTIRLLDGCVKNKVKRIVFLSSGGTVYGKEHDGILSECDEASPISAYGIQKLTIEKMLYLYKEMYGLDYRIVRLSNPYGPYQRPNGIQGVVSTFTWKALHDEPITVYGDGSVVRDYIYIDDAIEGIINISSDNVRYALYNLGSGIGLSVNEVTKAIESALDKSLKINFTAGRAVDVPINVLNISRYTEEFGNPVSVSLEDGVKRLLQFYENNR